MLGSADALEALIFLLIFAASAIFNWWKKRKEDSDWSQVEQPRPAEPHTPQPSAPPPVRKTTAWEEELRRMLESAGVPTQPTTPPPPVPAPPVIREYKREVPPPVQPTPEPSPISIPRIFDHTKTYEGHCEHCGGHIDFPSNMAGDTIVCPHCYQHTTLDPILETRVEKMHRAETVFTESSAAFQRASQLDEKVAAHLADVSRQRVGTTRVQQFKRSSEEIQHVVSLLRNPQTARQAILASVILAPPKALES